MRNKIWILAVLAIMVSLPFSAKADKEFLQKAQNILNTAQEKAKAAQEKIQELKDKLKSAAEGVSGVASDIKSATSAVRSGDIDSLKQFGNRIEALPSSKDAEKDEMAAAIEENYIPKTGQGNEDEKDREAKEFIQEVLRNATAKLYALGFTTRTNMQKEKPRDVDMSDSRQMLQETNNKSIEMIERLAQIYMLESAIEEYQYTQALRSIQIDASTLEENDNE